MADNLQFVKTILTQFKKDLQTKEAEYTNVALKLDKDKLILKAEHMENAWILRELTLAKDNLDVGHVVNVNAMNNLIDDLNSNCSKINYLEHSIQNSEKLFTKLEAEVIDMEKLLPKLEEVCTKF